MLLAFFKFSSRHSKSVFGTFAPSASPNYIILIEIVQELVVSFWGDMYCFYCLVAFPTGAIHGRGCRLMFGHYFLFGYILLKNDFLGHGTI